jgi:hypothetical protein
MLISMWICRNYKENPVQVEVGYYFPVSYLGGKDRFLAYYEWYHFCLCENGTEAAKVVNYLNGGNGYSPYMSLMDQLK